LGQGRRSAAETLILRLRNRFIVSADEKLTAFLELESATRESMRFQNAE
jgi:hypothetical protein